VPPRLSQSNVSFLRVFNDVDDVAEIDDIRVDSFLFGPMVGVPARSFEVQFPEPDNVFAFSAAVIKEGLSLSEHSSA
jgi:hypothetical protein